MIRWNEQRGTFEALDANGAVLPPEQLAAPLRAKLFGGAPPAPPAGGGHGGELVSGAIAGELPLGRSRPLPAPRVASGAQLSATDLEVCRQMGVAPAEFIAARQRQPHRWASEPFVPGSKP